MKKVLSLVLILVLCMAMSAMADSPTTNISAIATFPVIDVKVNTSSEAQTEVAAIETALATEGMETFYGEDVAALINAVSTGKLVALDALSVSGYEASMGDVTMTLSSAAGETLAAGTKVAVAIGVPNGVANGQTVYEWSVIEGIANGNGGVEVTLDTDTMTKLSVAGGVFAIYA